MQSQSRSATNTPAGGSLQTAAPVAVATTTPAHPAARTAYLPPPAERRPWDIQYLSTFFHRGTNTPVRFELTGGAAATGTIRFIERLNGEVVYVTGTLTEP